MSRLAWHALLSAILARCCHKTFALYLCKNWFFDWFDKGVFSDGIRTRMRDMDLVGYFLIAVVLTIEAKAV